MGTIRQRAVVLLLLLLQYAAVQVDGAACECTGKPAASTHCIAPKCAPSAAPMAEKPDGDCKKYTCASNVFLVEFGANEEPYKGEIKCDKTSKKWKAGALAVSAAVCAEKFSCKDNNALKSDCSAAVPTSNCDPIASFDNVQCTTPNLLFFKKKGATAWKQANEIACDGQTGKWNTKVTGTGAPNENLVKDDEVVCAASALDSTPSPCSLCADLNPPATCQLPACVPTPEIEEANGCKFRECAAGSTLNINGMAAPATTTKITCDGTSKWTSIGFTDPINDASCVAPPAPSQCAAQLKVDCDQKYASDPVKCEQVALTSSPVACSSPTHKLYFQKKDKKWAYAESVDCKNGNWTVKYKYGDADKEETLVEDDLLICGKENPDKEACPAASSVLTYENSGKYGSEKIPINDRSVGAVAKCSFLPPNENPYPKYSIFDRNISTEGTEFAVCGIDGRWETPAKEAANPPITLTGDFLCRRHHCKSCAGMPEVFTEDVKGKLNPNRHNPIFSLSECSNLLCNGDLRYIVRYDDGESGFYVGGITCENNKWLIGERKVMQASCVDKVPCHEYKKLKKCDNEMKEFDCEDINEIGVGKDTEPLKCNNITKKLMLLAEDSYWDEVHEMKCDASNGKWKIKLTENPVEQLSTGDVRVVCVSRNPNERPPPPTPPPPSYFCDECWYNLGNLTKCAECFKKEDYKITWDGNITCTAEANAKSQFLVNSEARSTLYCELSQNGSVIWKKSKNGDKKSVVNLPDIALQTKEKFDHEFRTWSYVIIGISVLLVGGSAIGAVLIYMKCRKKIGSKQKAKKERGVTRKYSSTNVVKTEPREAKERGAVGQSKEPTPSMNEGVEDAPTLKF